MNLNVIMQASKETLLETGMHPPMLHIHYKFNQADSLVLGGLPGDFQDMHRVLFLLGRDWGEKRTGRDIEALCFINEAYVARRAIDNPRLHVRPKDDPDHREALLFLVLDVVPAEPGEPKPTLKLSIHVVEQIRDNAGKILDLIPDDEPHETSTPSITPTHAFLAGWSSSRMSEERQREIIARAKRDTRKRRITEEWGQ